MIKISYNGGFHVSVKGHAGSDEYGKDLVCAAASILVYALNDLYGDLEALDIVSGRLAKVEPGDAEVDCTPKDCYVGAVRLQVQALCRGFRILADQEPSFVCYKEETL